MLTQLHWLFAKSPVFNLISMAASDELASGARPVATATQVRDGLPDPGVSSSQFLTARHKPDGLSWIWPGVPSKCSTLNCCFALFGWHGCVRHAVACQSHEMQANQRYQKTTLANQHSGQQEQTHSHANRREVAVLCSRLNTTDKHPAHES